MYGVPPVRGNSGWDARAESAQVGAGGGELLNAVVVPVGDIDIAIVVDGYAPRHIQFPFLASLNAESTQVFAVFGELLDPAVQAVYDPDVVVGIKRQAGRSAELAFPVTGLAPGAEQIAFGVENGYVVEPFVSDINPFVLVQSDGGKPGELTLLIAPASELADEVLILS